MSDVSNSELFSAYLDGELTADEQAGVEQLLSTDPASRQLLDEMRALSVRLQGLPQQKVGEDLSQRVLDVAARRMLVGNGEDASRLASGDEPRAITKTPESSDLKPIWKELSWRGLFSRRALAWSGIAVAVAIFLAWYDSQHKPAQRNAVHLASNVEDVKKNEPAVHALDKASGALGDSPPRKMMPKMSKAMGGRSEVLKSPEMYSADSPSNGPTPNDRPGQVLAKGSDAEKAVASGQLVVTPQTPASHLGAQGIQNQAFKKKAEDERVATAEKPSMGRPAPVPMSAPAAAPPAKPIDGMDSLASKGDAGKPAVLADEAATKRAMNSDRKFAAAKDEISTKEAEKVADLKNDKSKNEEFTNGSWLCPVAITPQAVNGRVFEQIIAQTGLDVQYRYGDRNGTQRNLTDNNAAPGNTAQNGFANLTRQDGTNFAGGYGGAGQQQPSPAPAPSGGALSGNTLNLNAGNAYYGNTAINGSATIALQNGATQNAAMQNGAAQNGITSNYAAQSLSTPVQNTQMPAIVNAADNTNFASNAGVNLNGAVILRPVPQFAEVDATADQIAALRKALSSHQSDFPSFSFPSEVDRLSQNRAEGNGGRAQIPKQSRDKAPSAAPESGAAAKSPLAEQAANKLTHIVFELRVVDPVSSSTPASPVAGALQSSSSAMNSFQYSGTANLSLTGSASYQQIAPGVAAPANPSMASPSPNAPIPNSKQ